ncbi:MAG: adenine phosphoribosyltransferase [Gammaproteobacteria bacterium]
MTATKNIEALRGAVKSIPDFPKAGIMFKDITPVLSSPELFSQSITMMCAPYQNKQVSKVIGIEARGFIFAVAMALQLNCGFIPIRKKGKLPREMVAQTYQLEYGEKTLELHCDSIQANEPVILVDDVLATGGTSSAAASLIEQLHGDIIGIEIFIELSKLSGRERLKSYNLHSLLQYED